MCKVIITKKWQYLNLSSITDNKLFWKTVSPLFTEINESKSNKIRIVEGVKVSSDNEKIAKSFNSSFGNIVNTLNIEKDENIFCYRGDETDPLLCAIKK